jgi:arylsulfatase A-like enzyme
LLVVHYYDPHGRFVPHAGQHWWQLPVTLYDGEVAHVDRWIGELLLAVDEARGDGPITVVVTSDHGDEFWDHRYARHVLRVYDESSRIVFLVDGGAGQKPVRFQTPVSGLDIGPTILDLFGIVAPSSRRGRSLADSVRTGAPPPARPILMHSGNFRTAAVVDLPYKLIWNRDTAFGELYDLVADPAERRNLLYRDRPVGAARELTVPLQCFLEELPSSRY